MAFDGRWISGGVGRYGSLVAVVAILLSQAPLAAQGIRRAGSLVFEKTCASIYCHGSRGLAGAAPAVAGKGLSQEQVNHIVSEGIPNTNMAGWKAVLSATDLATVIDYVIGLQVSTRSQRDALDPNRPWLKHAGRALFFDAGRIGPCGSCHEFDGLGLAVAPRFESRPSLNAAALRSLTSEKVRTVRPQDQGLFVGIAATSRAGLPRWYELRGPLPVLRTFAERPEDTGPASSWTHGDVVGSYKDGELERVFEFLSAALALPGN
jgi:mono/diheme cytochrome c family protein